ncbi:MAG TPA: RNA ligase [Candidatus Bilamarchaeum sp.]|nr:RNA ligase [Candidatus Bilamarchaeum sp.]
MAGINVAEALKRGKAERMEGGLSYVRFRESFGKVERGTVIVGSRVIWGFPHIKRIFTLGMGLKRNIAEETVYAEEKIDGFNVRVALVGDKIFAFSRGGILDMFVTEKAREMGLERFFRDNPEKILCCEMIGNTPHTRPAKDFDVRLFVFDIDTGDGSYVPVAEKYAMLKKYAIESVPQLGKLAISDTESFRKLALALNRGRKEGMVIKGAGRKDTVKYVTIWSDMEDIAGSSKEYFDMPAGFFHQRVLRSAFFMREFGLSREEYERMLGKAFYSGLLDALDGAARGEPVTEEYEILIGDQKIWDDIRHHMGKEVRLEVLWKREEGRRTRIRFRKIYKRTSRTLIAYAGGKGITD